MPARVERGRLYYGPDSYTKGDPVSVFSELTKQEFLGVVHILTPHEVSDYRGMNARVKSVK